MRSILIVDDNLASLKQISTQLSEYYDVSLAKSGELALKICVQEKPELILLDVEMPGMDGFDTIARLQQDQSLSQIPVIFLTGSSDTATEIRCLEAGGMDFIAKPANADVLRHRIKLHLEYSSCQHRLEMIEKELEDNIGISFAELVECKDRNVAGHILRTGLYAEILARELFDKGAFGGDLHAKDVDMLHRAAPFHDIGKIGVSDIILLKRGRLTPAEYEKVCKHPLIGGRMLETIYQRIPEHTYLKVAAIIAEGHHERFDGTGYPRRLRGEEIPLYCRIFSVANVYDACSTDRIYRRGLSHEEACRAVLDGKGTEFDPRVVEVFERLQEKFAVLHTQAQFQANPMEWSVSHEANLGN